MSPLELIREHMDEPTKVENEHFVCYDNPTKWSNLKLILPRLKIIVV